jgi:hypothetical protein
LPVVKTWVTSTVNREVAGSNPAAHRCKAVGVAQWQSAIPGRWFPGKCLFFAGGEDESYFATLEMQVSIPAAAFCGVV